MRKMPIKWKDPYFNYLGIMDHVKEVSILDLLYREMATNSSKTRKDAVEHKLEEQLADLTLLLSIRFQSVGGKALLDRRARKFIEKSSS